MKNLLLLFALFATTLAMAQNQKATLYFKNGNTINGLAEIQTDNTISFRTDQSSEKQIFTYRDLNGLTIVQDNIDCTYHYKVIAKKKADHPQLMKVVIEGQISLYSKTNSHTFGAPSGIGFPSGGNNSNTDGLTNTWTSYYVSRNGGDEVALIATTGTGWDKRLKKTGPKFFVDCPELVEKIKEKTFKKSDIEKVVEFYNRNCGI